MKCLKQAIPSNTFFSVVTFAGINVRRVLLTESMAERKHQEVIQQSCNFMSHRDILYGMGTARLAYTLTSNVPITLGNWSGHSRQSYT